MITNNRNPSSRTGGVASGVSGPSGNRLSGNANRNNLREEVKQPPARSGPGAGAPKQNVGGLLNA